MPWLARRLCVMALLVVGGCGSMPSPPPPARNLVLFVIGGAASDGSETAAIMTGVSAPAGVLGMDAAVSRGQCREAFGHETPTLLEDAKDAGLAAGLVTTERVTSAAPAAAYAHLTQSDWEADAIMPASVIAEGCRDIAWQLVAFEHHGPLDLIFGGGRLAFVPTGRRDSGDAQRLGVRQDGRDLAADWTARRPGSRYIWSEAQLGAPDASPPTGALLGLFAPDKMALQTHGAERGQGEPSLSIMTRRAVARLRRGPSGFVLVVATDSLERARSTGDPKQVSAETAELARAVQAAIETAGEADTLIVVAGDRRPALEGFSGHGVASARGPGALAFAAAPDARALHALLRAALPRAQR